VSVQFLEIYGEEVKDLLDPLGPGRVAIREQAGGGIAVVGAKEEGVESAEEMMLVLERGTLCRTTGSTLMNAQSSRSHAIFTVLLEHRIARQPQQQQQVQEAGDAAAATAAAVTDGQGEGQDGAGSVRVEVRKSKFHFVVRARGAWLDGCDGGGRGRVGPSSNCPSLFQFIERTNEPTN
jgi:hypothetical protein